MLTKEGTTQVLAIVAVLCAVTMTGVTVHDKLFPKNMVAGMETKPTQVRDWQKYATGGHRMGPTDAPVTILEFADFECPVCQSFANGALRAIRAQYPDKVAVIFRQWPLSYHRLAYPTARAAECAGAQERFEAFHDLVYSKQDSLGLKSYGQFAKDAGVPDLAAFETCNSSAAPIPSIEADIAAAKAVGGRGTPTILVNGLMLAGLPDSAKLEGYVQAAMRAAK